VNAFSLGGPFRLGSYNRDELRGSNYTLASLGYLKQLFRLPDFLGAGVLAGAWAETGSAFQKYDQAQFKWSGSAGLFIESLFGPIFGGVSAGEQGVKFYVSLAPLFR
jgi:hypothetical protein